MLPTSRGFDHHYGFWSGSEDHYSHMTNGAFDWRDDMLVDRNSSGIYSTELLSKRSEKVVAMHNSSRGPLFMLVSHQVGVFK